MKKLMSTFTLLAYLGTLPAGRAPAYALNAPTAEAPESRGFLAPLVIPPELGEITDFSFDPGRAGPLVVHIQDAHANPGAQENIVRLLEWLNHRNARAAKNGAAPELWVGLEGADGAIHPEYFDFFPDYPEVNDAIVRDLAGKGEIAGGELFAWNQHRRGKSGAVFYGIEEPGVYRKNLRTYRTLLFQRGEINLLLDGLRRNFDLAKSQLLTPDLQRFLREKKRRRDGDYGQGALNPQLGPYLEALAKQAREQIKIDLRDAIEQLRFPNAARLLKAQDLLSAAEEPALLAEEQAFFRQVESQFTPGAAREIHTAWQELEKGHFARPALEALLVKLKDAGVDFSTMPALTAHCGALMLQGEIKAGELSDEIELLEYWITERLIRNDAERNLLTLLERLDLLENILLGKLTNREFEKVLRYGKELAPSALDRNLRVLQAELPPLDKKNTTLEKYFQEALLFYHTAVKRDAILAARFLNGPGAADDAALPALGVLIAGGFHTTGIADSLARAGLNYVVVRPRMQADDHGMLYEKVMRDDHARFPAFHDAPELTKQEILLLRGLVETGIPALKESGGLSDAAAAQLALEAINRHPVLAGRLHASLENAGPLEKLRIFYKTDPVTRGTPVNVPEPDGDVRHNSGLGGASRRNADAATVRDTVLMVTPAVFSAMRARVGSRLPALRPQGEQLLAEMTVRSGGLPEVRTQNILRSESRKPNFRGMSNGTRAAVAIFLTGLTLAAGLALFQSLHQAGQENLKKPAANQPAAPSSPFEGKIKKTESLPARSENRQTPEGLDRRDGKKVALGLSAVAFIFFTHAGRIVFFAPRPKFETGESARS